MLVNVCKCDSEMDKIQLVSLNSLDVIKSNLKFHIRSNRVFFFNSNSTRLYGDDQIDIFDTIQKWNVKMTFQLHWLTYKTMTLNEKWFYG